MRNRGLVIAGTLVLISTVVWISSASAARISDVRNTKHNFSSTVTPNILGAGDRRTVKSTSESEICIFCHTPHGANTAAPGPLWNREIPASSTYTVYSSGSIDSTIQQPNGVSKLCLSCHDGSIAIGSVRNRAGSGGFRASTTTISMQGTGGGGVMAPGEGTTTGYTRFLGKDLRNDHPISLTYNTALVNADKEMRSPTQEPIHVRGLNPRPGIQAIHLQPENQANPTTNTGQVQCISCHDPHIRDTTNDNIKFLRFNRLQKARPDGSDTFLPATDIICLACHTKAGWEYSAHAQPAVANETYTNAAADVREFPRNTQVWETACLACHDTHTVQGSRRLLRAGTDASTFGSSSGYQIKNGNGNFSVEDTCFACHSPNRGTLNGQGGGTFEVPDTWSDFQLATHMPITTSEQAASQEMHNIGTTHPNTTTVGGGADFIEDPNLLGRNNLNNRHAECTDCHNPHRVTKRRSFTQTNANGAMDPEGTHDHAQPHTNIASGVLRGIWGVEPQYTSNSFHVDPSGFTVKRGNPTSTSTAVGSAYVTREYQVCFKCHSNHGFPNGYNGPPTLGVSTPSGTNNMTRYTNIAREYNSPSSHSGEPRSVGSDGGANGNWTSNNHRAWHPVMQPTGRNPGARGMTTPNIWLPPFRAVGTQTMYCTDCHGTNTANGTALPAGSQPNGKPWGPHGSTNIFLLKGPWSGDRTSGTGVGQPSHLCFKCHDFAQYADPNNTAPLNSGFQLGGGAMMGGGGGGGMCMDGGGMCMGMGGMNGGGTVMNNLHIFHSNQVTNFRCNLCHVAVPHGWKNKNFLVNLNDVGPEGGFGGTGNQVRNNTTAGYINGPYYNRAALKVASFAASGNWQPSNCGSIGAPGNGLTGVAWMAGGGGGGGMGGMGGGGGASSEACVNMP